jgi:putative membrane protein
MQQAAATVPYCGAPPLPGEVLAHWNLDPVLIAALLAATAFGARHAFYSSRHRLAYWGGFAALCLAFVSPLCVLGSGLFAARSAHHLLLVAVAAPLLGFAVGRSFGKIGAGTAAGAHILIFWIWHVPAAYASALSNDALYWIMQLSLVGSGFLFWSAFFRSKIDGTQVGTLVAVMAQMALLGALLTFAPAALYSPHYLTTQLYGLTPLEDQQLGGLIMWVASLPLYAAAAAPAIARFIARSHRWAA